MTCSIVKGLIAGSVIGLIFFSSCSKRDVAQAKNYEQILYGDAYAKETTPAPTPVTAIHSASRESVPVSIDTAKYLTNRTLALFTDPYMNSRVAEKLDLFYRANGFKTKWLYTAEPAQVYYALIANLNNAAVHGLSPDDYNSPALEKAVRAVYASETPSAAEIMALDIRLTELYFLFTTHVQEGKVRKTGFGNNVWLRNESLSKSIADVQELVNAKTGKDLVEVLQHIQPAGESYKRLQNALAQYRNLERYAIEALPAVSMGGKVEPNTRNKAIPLIRKRLSQFDLHVYPVQLDSVTGQWDSLLYDSELVRGIIAFQQVHGLEPDGVIGPKTITFINQSLRSRVEAIAVNMDRMRWTPAYDKERQAIIVNVPEYKLYIYDKDKEVFSMRVIVGALDNPTPIFNDEVKNVVFSPTWTVPVSIIKNEIIPRLKANPAYYTERNYVFYKNGEQIDPETEAWGETSAGNYRVVQQPGGDNSLGRVKFGMTNDMRIYLHDTPSQRLFAKDFRAMSHGCIRLDEPAKFAEYLLRENNGWDMDRINKQMFSGTASTVILKKDYPVHIQYYTAWVTEDGHVNFREDIYGHDRMQVQQLNKPALKVTESMAGL